MLAPGAPGARPAPGRLQEAEGLARALDLDVVRTEPVLLRRVSPGLFFGAGKADALAEAAVQDRLDVVVVDAALSPVQQRNLEKRLQAKVVDRTGLILEIFGRRAQTREGKLQVELARLEYERSRLVRTWTHLERQRGGLGKTGGPGETQLELDRRQIGARIDKLKLELEEVRRTRGLQRRARARSGLPSVVLVGYTNAGKSTLFNRLTDAQVLAKDLLFATLDPTVRAVRLPHGGAVALSDTVGFISDLPTDLIAAFRATLEAAAEADLLVHVRDASHPESEQQKCDVEQVLEQVFAEAGRRPPMLEVLNKLDLLSPEQQAARMARADAGEAVALSASTGLGLPALLEAVDLAVHGPRQTVRVLLDPADGRLRAWVGAHGRVLHEEEAEGGLVLADVELPKAQALQLLERSQEVRPLAAE